MIGKILILSFAVFLNVRAEESPLPRSRDVVVPNPEQQNLVSIPLDEAVYKASTDDFSDLRLVDQDGVERPFLLQKIASQKRVTRRQPSNGKTITLQTSGDEGIIITLELDNDAAHADGLTVVTNQKDFEYRIDVEGSNDGQIWESLIADTLIYDYSRFMQIGNQDISLPHNTFKYFKILIAHAIQTRTTELMELTRTLRDMREIQRNEKTDVLRQPLNIERIQLWHNQTETVADSEQIFTYQPLGFTVNQDAEHKATWVDVSVENQPLTGLHLDIETPVFNRRAEVQVETKQGLETLRRTITTATLSALRFQDINYNHSALHFTEQRQQNYRVLIYNQDSPPLAFKGVSASGPGYELLFIHQPGNSYQVHYDSSPRVRPNYDIASIRELQRKGYASVKANLGPETEAKQNERPWRFADLLDSNLFLGLVIGLMVLVLAWSLYKVAKRVVDEP